MARTSNPEPRLPRPAASAAVEDHPSRRPGEGRGAAGRHAELVAAACRQLERAERVPPLRELAARAGLSPFHFHRVFKEATGLTPRAYAAAERGRRVRERLARGETSITAALYDAGFGSNGRFYEASDGLLGMRPKDYRAGGAHAEIRFAVGECSLGSILVARSARGVCAILLGDDPDRLVRDLQDRFPRAALAPGDAGFERWVAEVVGLVENPALGLGLPLDIRGTAFQERVWRALRAIPPGSTASYAEIAKRIGSPGAVRAVAQACGANPLAVAIPCHRVVRSDGGLSGYRWGVERKRALLEREREAAGAPSPAPLRGAKEIRGQAPSPAPLRGAKEIRGHDSTPLRRGRARG